MRRAFPLLALATLVLPAAADDVEQVRISVHLEHWFSSEIQRVVDPDVYLEIWVDGDRECHRTPVLGRLPRNTASRGAPIAIRPAGDAIRINFQLYDAGERHGAADRYVASRTLFLKGGTLHTAADETGQPIPSGDWVNLRDSTGGSRGKITLHYEAATVSRRGRPAPGVYRLHVRHRLAGDDARPSRLRLDPRNGGPVLETRAARARTPGAWSSFQVLDPERHAVLAGHEWSIELAYGEDGYARRRLRLDEAIEDEVYSLEDIHGTKRGEFQIRFVPVPLEARLAPERVHRLAVSYRLWGAAAALQRTRLAVRRNAAPVCSTPPAAGLGHAASHQAEVEIEVSPFDRIELVAIDATTETLVARRSLFLEELAAGEYTLYGEGGESLGLATVEVGDSAQEHARTDADAGFFWALVRALLAWELKNPATYDGLIESYETLDATGVRDEDLLEYRDATLQVCRSFDQAGVAPRDSGLWKIAKGVTLIWKDPVLGIKSSLDYPKHRKLFALLSVRYSYFPLHLGDRVEVEPLPGGGTRIALDVHGPVAGDEERCDVVVQHEILGPTGPVASGETRISEKVTFEDWTVRATIDIPGLDPGALDGLRLRIRVVDAVGGRWSQRIYPFGD